jgi:choice-of-anchor B domain-containing protein
MTIRCPFRSSWRRRLVVFVLIACTASTSGSATAPTAPEDEHEHRERPIAARAVEVMRAFQEDLQPEQQLQAMSLVQCQGGFAGVYPCSNVDLLAFLPLAAIGGGAGNDLWGWSDPVTGKEYAIMGRTLGTSFVDISDPQNPVYLGNLPTHGVFGSSWRDIKVYADHAFIVSEAMNHGLQVFDLAQLRTVSSPPVTFSETAHYNTFRTAHNIAINEDTGYAYVVGSNICGEGLHMVDVSDPLNPVDAGCYAGDGYTHDAQCVIYQGPDTTHQGSEICFNSNEDTLTIVDVTNKAAPVQLSSTGYSGVGYTHQGWLTEDHAYFLLGDEKDEQDFAHNTRTRVWDVSDLANPSVIGFYDASTPAIDHNIYVRGGLAYQANYRAGLRILDLANVASGALAEVAFFDIYPDDDDALFNGAWSVYPYFSSGVVVVSGIEQGLFVLGPQLAPTIPALSAQGWLGLTSLLLAVAAMFLSRSSAYERRAASDSPEH